MKVAWANYKLKQAMKNKIVRFYYRKVSGEIREAFGSLQEKLLPATKKAVESLMIRFSLITIQNVKAGGRSNVLIYFLLVNLKRYNYERRMARY